ncbi:MAG: hypothetical protein ACR2Q4_10920 [Geminicoccaceae bacterium]
MSLNRVVKSSLTISALVIVLGLAGCHQAHDPYQQRSQRGVVSTPAGRTVASQGYGYGYGAGYGYGSGGCGARYAYNRGCGGGYHAPFHPPQIYGPYVSKHANFYPRRMRRTTQISHFYY